MKKIWISDLMQYFFRVILSVLKKYPGIQTQTSTFDLKENFVVRKKKLFLTRLLEARKIDSYLHMALWLYAGPSVTDKAWPTWVCVSPSESLWSLKACANSLISSKSIPSGMEPSRWLLAPSSVNHQSIKRRFKVHLFPMYSLGSSSKFPSPELESFENCIGDDGKAIGCWLSDGWGDSRSTFSISFSWSDWLILSWDPFCVCGGLCSIEKWLSGRLSPSDKSSRTARYSRLPFSGDWGGW